MSWLEVLVFNVDSRLGDVTSAPNCGECDSNDAYRWYAVRVSGSVHKSWPYRNATVTGITKVIPQRNWI